MEKIENLLHRDREEILGFCGRYDSVFIYGAGKVAKEMILYLAEEEIHIKGIIVGTGHKKAESYCGYYVSEITNMQEQSLWCSSVVFCLPYRQKHLISEADFF